MNKLHIGLITDFTLMPDSWL